MDWLKELGKDNRGSRPRCVLFTDSVAGRLRRLICRPEVEVFPEDQWQPQGTSDSREAQLDKTLKGGAELLPEATRQKLRDWWLGKCVDSSRTPVWDIASTCTISDKKGLLLVEAKAHSEELKKDDKCSAKDPNRERIKSALEEANTGLRKLTGGPWQLSADHHYQLSNRFAWSWKLATLGVPVALLYLGFLKAEEMANDGRAFRSDGDWQNELRSYCKDVVDAACWEQVWDVEGTPLLPLRRTIEQPLDPQ